MTDILFSKDQSDHRVITPRALEEARRQARNSLQCFEHCRLLNIIHLSPIFWAKGVVPLYTNVPFVFSGLDNLKVISVTTVISNVEAKVCFPSLLSPRIVSSAGKMNQSRVMLNPHF